MEKWYTKFVNKNKFYIKWSHIILLHIKIRLQHRGRYDCITTLTIAINKGIRISNKSFGKSKINLSTFSSLIILKFVVFSINS